MNKPSNPVHDEPKLFWYDQMLKLGKMPFFRHIGLLVSLIFIRVAPEIPVSLKKSYSGPEGYKAGIVGFLLTFIFAFIGNLIGSSLNGTLIGEDPNIIYYFNDWWNLLLYALICPIYVGLTCWLVVIVIKSWSDIADFKDQSISVLTENKKYSWIKGLALGLMILSIAFLLTTNYINDILNMCEESKYYWFLKVKNHQLGGLGVYYFLLNFCLLLVTLIALTAFMSIYKLLMSVGRALASRNDIGQLEFDELKTKLSAFTEGYIVTKGIIAAYIINVWVWADSPIGKGTTTNLVISLVLLTLIGFFLVSFPRYYVELQWFKLKARASDKELLNKGYEDLRSFEIKIIAQVIDWIFIGGFAFYAVQKIVEILNPSEKTALILSLF